MNGQLSPVPRNRIPVQHFLRYSLASSTGDSRGTTEESGISSRCSTTVKSFATVEILSEVFTLDDLDS